MKLQDAQRMYQDALNADTTTGTVLDLVLADTRKLRSERKAAALAARLDRGEFVYSKRVVSKPRRERQLDRIDAATKAMMDDLAVAIRMWDAAK